MKSVLILLVAVVAGISAKNCCFPDEFEIDLGLVSYEGQGYSYNSSNKIAFDYNNKRAAILCSTFVNGTLRKDRTILDFKKGISYLIDMEYSSCIAGNLSISMSRCIPDAARPAGSSYLGNNQLTVDSYSYTQYTPEGTAKINVILQVTKDECIPVGALAVKESEGGGLMLTYDFTGYVEGIKSPSIFDVPSFCPKTVNKTKKSKMFKHHLNLLYL